MSGTTCVVTLLYRDILVCANAGDSRAVLFSEKPTFWRAIPVSRDHKPELPDEATRIINSNGRVE